MKKLKLSKIAIVAGDGLLAEKVCSHFRSNRIYLPTFEAPLKRLVKYGVFAADCLRLANAIKYLRSETVLLLRCKEEVTTELRRQLLPGNIIEFGTFDKKALSRITGYKEPIQNFVDFTTADDIPNGHIVAVEDHNNLSRAISRNLAQAIGGNVVVIPPASREDAQKAQDYLRLWSTANSSQDRKQALDDLLDMIKKRLLKLASTKVKSISFITEGIPYGIFPFGCPTTHFFNFPLLGLNVIRGMMKTLLPFLSCMTTYLVDPGELPESEYESLRKFYLSRGYIVRNSFGKNATAREVDYCTQYLPLDLIFYSTHCGEVTGRRIKERFETADGKEHVIVYDQAASFSPEPGNDLIEVLEFKRWVSLDGISWDDNAGKDRINAEDILGQYLEKHKRRDGDSDEISIIETNDLDKVKYSDALKMSDSNFIPMPTELGNHRYPIVFNNACSSWRELAHRFAVAGACAYIGASTDIPNSIAIDIVTKFAQQLTNGRSLGYSIYMAQRSYIIQMKYSPYLMHGYLFTKCIFSGSRETNAKSLLWELRKSIKKWDEQTTSAQSKEQKINSQKISSFLMKELEHFERMLRN